MLLRMFSMHSSALYAQTTSTYPFLYLWPDLFSNHIFHWSQHSSFSHIIANYIFFRAILFKLHSLYTLLLPYPKLCVTINTTICIAIHAFQIHTDWTIAHRSLHGFVYCISLFHSSFNSFSQVTQILLPVQLF